MNTVPPIDTLSRVCADRRIARALRLVTGDLTKRVTLREAARIAGLRPAYFSRRFRTVTGVCFGEWSTRARIEEAKLLLRVIDLSITAVAAAVGYSDITTFERAFRRVVDMRPREFRRLASGWGSASLDKEQRNLFDGTGLL